MNQSEPGGARVTPRIPDPQLLELLVRQFSQGAFRDYDPVTGRGSQRENLGTMGFGILYLALAQMLEVEQALVIGSGHGFSAAAFALGLAPRASARVTLVDPGLTTWDVDGRTSDRADGFWDSEEQAAEHFRRHLGLTNVRYRRATSDAAFAEYRAAGQQFDLILVDGEHSLEQAGRDLSNAAACLAPGGMILMHDAACARWTGVAAAIEQFTLGAREFQGLTLPLTPGLALLMRRQPLLTLRHAMPDENETINVWRREAGVTPRPLPGGDDPRVGEIGPDPRLGLFAVIEEGQLVGGVGLRTRRFSAAGPDDFAPDCGHPLEGVLRYGSVIRPDLRGRGRFQLVNLQILRWFGEEGFYFITDHAIETGQWPMLVERVGATARHTAYRMRPPARLPEGGFAQGGADRYADAVRCALERDAQVVGLKARLNSIEGSLAWRATKPLRAVLDWLRRV
jgi:predicted O-methyltransferase YrrM